MSFKPLPQRCFSDIKHAIAMIEQFTSGMDFEAFRSNPMAVAAVGNQLRHAYERVDLATVWDTITDDLPPLKVAVTRALAP